MNKPQADIKSSKRLSPVQIEIIDKLAYFAVFGHPLREKEIQNLLLNYYSAERVSSGLEDLIGRGLCFSKSGYFSINKQIANEIDKRVENEQNARYFIKKLPFYARLMSNFPFVRGIAISGSLSKGVMHTDGDIDYFIITAENRLWLTRMLLVVFKKFVLFNSHRFFCVNYFVSENHLQIPDENLFTATEVSTLLPVYGNQLFADFRKANNWVGQYYGHFEHPINLEEVSPLRKGVKRFSEWLFNNALGNYLDLAFMYITIWRWDVKFKRFNRAKFNLTMRSERNVSKHHPRDFQTVVLNKMTLIKTTLLEKVDNR